MSLHGLHTRLKRLEVERKRPECQAYAVPEVTEEYAAEVWQLLQTYGGYASWEEGHVARHASIYGREDLP